MSLQLCIWIQISVASSVILALCSQSVCWLHISSEFSKLGPQPDLAEFMLNSAEHDFFLLINVEMPTIVGILTFMNRKNSIIGLSEPGKGTIS